MPIRETFEKVGIINDDENAIIYDNGKITVTIQANQLQPASKYTYEITVGDRNIILNPLEASENMGLNVAYQLTNVPVLKDNITYIPYELTHYLFAGRYDVEIGYEYMIKTIILQT